MHFFKYSAWLNEMVMIDIFNVIFRSLKYVLSNSKVLK